MAKSNKLESTNPETVEKKTSEQDIQTDKDVSAESVEAEIEKSDCKADKKEPEAARGSTMPKLSDFRPAARGSGVLGDDGPGGTAPDLPEQNVSLVDTFYKQIDLAIGGDNPKQFFCLTLPGQALTAEDYSYDYKNHAPKGPVVEANESRLANKMFDPCRITAGDNGTTLPYQYRTALDMLTPKLNEKVARAKNELRQLLMTEYPYDFGDGSDRTYTLQEVFFRLYDDWVAASEEWAKLQSDKKEELRKAYPGTDAASNTLYNDKYYEWYEDVAESYLNQINEKMSKVISVFTPNDMKILEGILDSGSGAELQEARQTLTNTQKLSPSGGYVYPVSFSPTNWFELLDTSFTPIDLLKTPAALAEQLQILSTGRRRLKSRIDDISAMIPSDQEISDLKTSVDNCKKDLNTAEADLIGKYGEGFSTVINTLLDVAPLFAGGAIPEEIISRLAPQKTPGGDEIDIKALVEELTKALPDITKAQQAYTEASQKLADTTEKYIETKNLANLKNLLSPLKEQLADTEDRISDLQTQIQMASVKQSSDAENEDSVAPPSVPDGYTQIVINTEASALTKETSSSSSSDVSTSGLSLWFGGYHSQSESESSAFNNFTADANSSLQIGMNIAKVSIERDWFNPGVFALTKDMFNVTSLKIAPNPATPYKDMDERIRDMAASEAVFPCYPVAMVIARDISIKLTAGTSMESDFSRSCEQHASTGGGFLFFSGSSSSSSSSSSSGVHSSSTDTSVTLKFTTPQIIGYYLEATSPDKSSYLDDTSGDAQAGYVTISQFVEDYRKMLQAMAEKKQGGN